jgi:hypothetical membrane protein
MRNSASDPGNSVAAGGIIWVCAVQFFVAQGVVQSRWTTPFSLATNYISDLGNTTCGPYPALGGPYVCSPWHTLMNVSFVLQGIIVLAGVVLARSALAGVRTGLPALILFALTAVGMAGVGLFPEDVNNRAHVISAGVQFITSNAAMILCGIAANRVRRRNTFAAFSTTLGVTGLLATVLFAQGYGLRLGVGGMERIAAYTLPVWLITTGILLATKRASSILPDRPFDRVAGGMARSRNTS